MSLALSAYERIRRLIIRAELAPGYRFTELALAEMLDVGKTPIREALARLVQNGLVESIPRVGYRITPITLREMVQLFEYRLIVEPASARMAAAAGLSREHEAVLLDIVNRPLPPADDPHFVDAITADNYTFHLTVAEASSNPRLVRAVDDVLLEGERLYRLVIAGLQPSHDHRRITEALLAGQQDRAADLTREHIDVVRTRIMDTYLSSQAVLESELVFPRGDVEQG